jgi:hypothetical protein
LITDKTIANEISSLGELENGIVLSQNNPAPLDGILADLYRHLKDKKYRIKSSGAV